MEKMTTGLALEELEAQRVELLPDRVEMHVRKKRIRRKNINCDAQAIAVLLGVGINGAQQCFIVD